jgi:ATP-dependent DNA helicase RecG
VLSHDDLQVKLKTEAGQYLAHFTPTAEAKDFAKQLMAFANADGGYLLISDTKGNSLDTQQAQDLVESIIEAATQIHPVLVIPIPKIVEQDSKNIVVAHVPKGLPAIYSFEGLYLHRYGQENRPLEPATLRRLMLERGEFSFESSVPRNATLEHMDWDKAEDYARRIPSHKYDDTKDLLYQRGCLTRIDGTLYPTYAGVLLFGKQPKQFAYGAEITAVRFPSQRMTDHFNRQDIQGTLLDQIKQVETFLYDNLRKNVSLQTDMAREEAYEYPMEAAREIVLNAIAHRDYSIMGDNIRLYIYSDRLEVSSPGGLAGPMTLANLQHSRFSRNPIIVQVLSDLHYIERLGYGVDRVLTLMAKQNLDAPNFNEEQGAFVVTLKNTQREASKDTQTTSIQTPQPTSATPQTAQTAFPATTTQASDSGEKQAILEHYRDKDLNERQEAALVYLHQSSSGRISNSDLKGMYPDVHPETIRRDLVALVNQDILLKMGQKRGSYYVLKAKLVNKKGGEDGKKTST